MKRLTTLFACVIIFNMSTSYAAYNLEINSVSSTSSLDSAGQMTVNNGTNKITFKCNGDKFGGVEYCKLSGFPDVRTDAFYNYMPDQSTPMYNIGSGINNQADNLFSENATFHIKDGNNNDITTIQPHFSASFSNPRLNLWQNTRLHSFVITGDFYIKRYIDYHSDTANLDNTAWFRVPYTNGLGVGGTLNWTAIYKPRSPKVDVSVNQSKVSCTSVVTAQCITPAVTVRTWTDIGSAQANITASTVTPGIDMSKIKISDGTTTSSMDKWKKTLKVDTTQKSVNLQFIHFYDGTDTYNYDVNIKVEIP